MNKLRLTGLLLTRLLGLWLVYVSCVQVSYAQQSGGGNYPTGNGVRVKEVDGSPNVPGTQTLVFPNGSLTRAGQTVTVTIAGGTTINSTNGQVPYRVNSTTFGDSAISSNALSATGISVTSAAAGSGVTIAAISSGSNERIVLTPKGTGSTSNAVESATTFLAGANPPYPTDTNAAYAIGDGTRGIYSPGGNVVSVAAGGWSGSFGPWGQTIPSTRQLTSGTHPAYGGDVGLGRFAAAVWRLTNGSTGAGQLLLGTSTDTADAQLSVYSQSTTRPGLKLRALTATSASQNMEEVYDASGTLSYAVRADGKIVYVAGNTASTVGAAGGASALPATPTGYLQVVIGGTTYKIPYYAD